MPVTSLHQVDNLSEANAGNGVTITGRKVGKPPNTFANGVTDDSAALATAFAGFAPGDVFELGPGTYYIGANLTVSCALRPTPGAVFRIGAGKTLTIAGPFDPGWYQVFDPTMPGNVTFTGSMPRHAAQWYGAKADAGVTDNSVAVNFILKNLSASSVVEFSLGDYYFRAPIVWQALRGITLTGGPDRAGDPDAINMVRFIWDGDFGGRMHIWDRCNLCKIDNIAFYPLGLASTGNYGSIASGSAVFTTLNGSFSGLPNGTRIVVWGAGPNGDPLVTTIQGNTGGTATLAANALTTVTRAEWMTGTLVGLPAKCAIDATGNSGPGDVGVALANMDIGTNRVYLHVPVNSNSTPRNRHFFPDYVGRQVTIPGAGPAGADLVTTFTGYRSDTAMLTAANALTSAVDRSITIAGLGGPSAHGSQCRVTGSCHFYAVHGFYGDMLEFIRIAPGAGNNHEFYVLEHPFFNGNGFRSNAGSFSTTAGSPNVTGSIGGGQAGYRIRIEGAGPSGGVLDTYLLSSGSGTGVMAVNATGAVTNAYGLTGEGKGVGVRVGPSSNSLKHRFNECDFTNMDDCFLISGSFISRITNFGSCEKVYHYAAASRVCTQYDDVGENTSQYLQIDGQGSPIVVVGLHIDASSIQPGGAYFNMPSAGGVLHMIACEMQALLPTNSVSCTLFNVMTNTSRITVLDEFSIVQGLTLARAGLAFVDGGSYVDFRNCGGFTDAPARSWTWNQNQKYHTSDVLSPGTGLFVEHHTRGGGGGRRTAAAFTGKVADGLDAGTEITALTLDANAVQPAQIQSQVLRGLLLKQPVITPGAGAQKATTMEGGRVTSPVITAPGGTQLAVGFVIEPQAGSGVDAAQGIQQLGTSDGNLFAGPTSIGGATPTPITNIRVYTPTLTPTSVAAGVTQENTFTVTGLTTADKVIVNGPAPTNSIALSGARVSAANTLAVQFCNPTAGALTPVSGTYLVIAIRS